MNKKLIQAFLIILVVTLVLWGAHTALFSTTELPFSITKMYLFHGVFASILILSSIFMADFMKNSIGFLFLGLMMLKMLFLYIVFPEVLQTETSLPKNELLQFVVPYFTFLTLEILLMAKLLKETVFEGKKEN